MRKMLLFSCKSQLRKSALLTYNFGMDDDRFPLTFLTEVKVQVIVVDIDTRFRMDLEKTMGRLSLLTLLLISVCQYKPGLGGAEFAVHFYCISFIEQYSLIARR